jgi:FMN phosphatase YigB (HAD superfamily)
MRIAFDLDGTLLECGFAFPTIKKWPKVWMNLCGIESLREGSIELMQFFQQQGEEVWIYTTSYRIPTYIRLIFLLHGFKVKGVINQAIHDQKLRKRPDWPRCSKYPPAFGIDLLIDDQEGVKLEAERHGFQMIWIRPSDKAWVEKVKTEYARIIKEKNPFSTPG